MFKVIINFPRVKGEDLIFNLSFLDSKPCSDHLLFFSINNLFTFHQSIGNGDWLFKFTMQWHGGFYGTFSIKTTTIITLTIRRWIQANWNDLWITRVQRYCNSSNGTAKFWKWCMILLMFLLKSNIRFMDIEQHIKLISFCL